MSEQWQGADGAWYYKDQYGYVYKNNVLVGRDLPTGGSNTSLAPTSAGMRPYGVPSNFIYNPQTNTWNAPQAGSGQGSMYGGYQQPNWQQGNFESQMQLAGATYAQQMQSLQLAQQQQNAALASANSQAAATMQLERDRLAQEASVSAQNLEIQRQQQAAEQAKDEMLRREAVLGVEGDPRKFVQSLFLRNMDNAGVANYLNQLPYVQGIRAGTNMPNATLPTLAPLAQTGTPPTWEQIQASQQAAAPGTGLNPSFEFPRGRALPVQQTLFDIQTNSPRKGLLESLGSYAGYDPAEMWGDFEAFLPKGGTIGPSTYR